LQFLGLRQIKDEKSCSVLTDDCSLDTTGILSVVRHPWYAGGILIVWARPLDAAAVLTNLVITGYFIVGAFLEERKLKLQFGQAYDDYRRQVSMSFKAPFAGDRRLDNSQKGPKFLSKYYNSTFGIHETAKPQS